jgi:hypothetical protein
MAARRWLTPGRRGGKTIAPAVTERTTPDSPRWLTPSRRAAKTFAPAVTERTQPDAPMAHAKPPSGKDERSSLHGENHKRRSQWLTRRRRAAQRIAPAVTERTNATHRWLTPSRRGAKTIAPVVTERATRTHR